MKNKGFTLVELLVVILIIGILTAIALPQYRFAIEKARVQRMLPLLRVLHNAQRAYFMINLSYAASFDELSIEPPAGAEVNREKTVYKYTHIKVVLEPKDIKAFPDLNTPTYFLKWYNEGLLDCWAQASNTLANKICQHASGHRTPTSTSGGFNEYPMNK